MTKYFVTFGTGQLENFAVNAGTVMVVVEADSESEARARFFEEPFNGRFSSSYNYDQLADDFKNRYHMVEYTLEELLATQFN